MGTKESAGTSEVGSIAADIGTSTACNDADGFVASAIDAGG